MMSSLYPSLLRIVWCVVLSAVDFLISIWFAVSNKFSLNLYVAAILFGASPGDCCSMLSTVPKSLKDFLFGLLRNQTLVPRTTRPSRPPLFCPFHTISLLPSIYSSLYGPPSVTKMMLIMLLRNYILLYPLYLFQFSCYIVGNWKQGDFHGFVTCDRGCVTCDLLLSRRLRYCATVRLCHPRLPPQFRAIILYSQFRAETAFI